MLAKTGIPRRADTEASASKPWITVLSPAQKKTSAPREARPSAAVRISEVPATGDSSRCRPSVVGNSP